MANYPPSPPGAWGPPGSPPAAPPPADPYAAERELTSWAAESGYEIHAQPDLTYYVGWYPFQYLPRISAVVRELRGKLGSAQLFVADAQLSDPLGQLVGGSRSLLWFLLSDQLRYRGSLRSKQTAGVADDLNRGLKQLGNLFSGGGASPPPAGAVLGDAVLEQQCDVAVPSRDEGNWALTMPLRQIVAQPTFRGIVEVRAGGMAVNLFGSDRFDKPTLAAGVATVQSLFEAAIAYPASPG